MISRTHYSVQERDTRSRAAQLLANQPFFAVRWYTLPHLRQVLLSLSTRPKTPPVSPPLGKSKFAPTSSAPSRDGSSMG